MLLPLISLYVRLLRDILLLLSLAHSGSLLGQALLLLGLGLRAVLVEQLESLGCGVPVKDVLELGNRRGDLQAEVENLLLALKTDVRRPPNHARHVALGLDVLSWRESACKHIPVQNFLTNAEVLGTLLQERVLGLLARSSSLGLLFSCQ